MRDRSGDQGEKSHACGGGGGGIPSHGASSSAIAHSKRYDETANVLSHALGLALSCIGGPFLVRTAIETDDAANVIGSVIYGVTLVSLYASSTMYHLVRGTGRLKRFLRLVDHGCIYLLIAGTYTPVSLSVLRGGWGWTLLSVIWTLAGVGLLFKAAFRHRYEIVSILLYLLMGWLSMVAVKPLLERMPGAAFVWLVAGGAAYTLGVAFYIRDQRPLHHAVWHMFVLAGSSCHFFAVLACVKAPSA